jgi:hypothetical protein
VIHPGAAFDRQIERGVRRIGGAVHEQQCALRAKGAHVGGPLVAHENIDPGIVRRHHEVFGGELRLRARRGFSTNAGHIFLHHGRHGRSKNGFAELVIGPATSGRTRWLAYVPAISLMRALCSMIVMPGSSLVKPGHDEEGRSYRRGPQSSC